MNPARCFFILLLTGLITTGFSQNTDLKSMIGKVNLSVKDSSEVELLLSICDSLFRTNPEQTLKYGTDAIEISRNIKYSRGEAYAFKYLGLAYFVKGEYVKAIKSYQQSLEIFQKINYLKGTANILSNMGAIYNNEGNDAKALELYLQSLHLSEEINDSVRIVTALINIGLTYSKKEITINKAEEAYLKALTISETLNYLAATGTVLTNLGELYYKKGDYRKALTYYERALNAFRQTNTGNIAFTLISIGKIYAYWKYYPNAFKYLEEGLQTAEKDNSKLEIGQAYIAIASTYLQRGSTNEALDYFARAEKITKEIGALYEQEETYEGLSLTYAKKSDFRNAYKFQLMASQLKDSIQSEASRLQLHQLQVQYEIESMLKENEILKRDAKLREAKSQLQKIVIIFLVAGFILAFAFLVQLIRANNHKKRANRILTEKNRLITAQKKAITDSIVYAKRIQNALLPPSEIIGKILPESFIFFRPRDIVSGDFYWMTKTHGKTFLITADCTGHGVPGAFMSMLGISFCNEIVSINPELPADGILNELRSHVVKTLHQKTEIMQAETKDGMDLALLILDDNQSSLEFAGANNPLIIVRNNELMEFKPDKMPIGVHLRTESTFTNHRITLEKGDMLYTFSDGYIDQFGGEAGKKFMSKNFRNMLIEIGGLSLPEQKKIIEDRFVKWKGHYDQVDDVLVIGVRV